MIYHYIVILKSGETRAYETDNVDLIDYLPTISEQVGVEMKEVFTKDGQVYSDMEGNIYDVKKVVRAKPSKQS